MTKEEAFQYGQILNIWGFCQNSFTDKGQKILEKATKAPTLYPDEYAKFNPYDPEWEMYGEVRQQQRLSDQMQHRCDRSSLYKSQSGKCVLCAGMITKETGWHDHHIVYRIHGGTNALKNRALLHPVCHHKVHNLGLSVKKPTPVKKSLMKA